MFLWKTCNDSTSRVWSQICWVGVYLTLLFVCLKCNMCSEKGLLFWLKWGFQMPWSKNFSKICWTNAKILRVREIKESCALQHPRGPGAWARECLKVLPGGGALRTFPGTWTSVPFAPRTSQCGLHSGHKQIRHKSHREKGVLKFLNNSWTLRPWVKTFSRRS